MAISPIGFTGAATVGSKESFKDIVNEMPAHRRTDTPNSTIAATKLNSNNQEESHWLRNTLIGTGTAAGGAFLLKRGHQKGWFHVEKDASGPITWVKKKLDSAGEFVDKQWNKVKTFFSSEEKPDGKTSGSDNK